MPPLALLVWSYRWWYFSGMASVKPTISLDPDLHALVERLADAEGVTFSAWTAEALRRRARNVALSAAISEHEDEFGPLTVAARNDALAELGLPPLGEQEAAEIARRCDAWAAAKKKKAAKKKAVA